MQLHRKMRFILLFLTALLASTATLAQTEGIDPVVLAKANAGDAEAQGRLGLSYLNGQGVLQDYVQASAWFRKAAEQGDSKAQVLLGSLYEKGKGVPQNFARNLTAMDNALCSQDLRKGFLGMSAFILRLTWERKGRSYSLQPASPPSTHRRQATA
jgi:TPR repeat protein